MPIDDVTGRAGQLRDLGTMQLVECADRALAVLIARDRRAGKLCRPVGDCHLAVPAEHGAAFRTALRALGYPLRCYRRGSVPAGQLAGVRAACQVPGTLRTARWW